MKCHCKAIVVAEQTAAAAGCKTPYVATVVCTAPGTSSVDVGPGGYRFQAMAATIDSLVNDAPRR